MKRLIFSLVLAFPLSAMANSELNGDDVTAKHQITGAVDPSAQSVIIHFNKNGVPDGVVHSAEKLVKTSQVTKLAFAQMTLAAEDPKALPDSTPSTEMKDAQGTPQWGFWGGGAIYRGPFGGVVAVGGRGFYGGGYGWGGYGWNGYYPNYAAAGWGCGGYYGDCGYRAPIYYYRNCAYSAVGYYGGGYDGGYYGYYQPSYYY